MSTSFNFNNLSLGYVMDMCKKTSNGVRWKESTTIFEYYRLLNSCDILKEFTNNNIDLMPTYDFTIHERGKIREVKAHHIVDRTKLKVVTQMRLIPITKPYIFRKNSASQVGKGTLFAIQECKKDMLSACRNFNGKFYVVTYDFSNFFGSLDHEIILNLLHKYGFGDDDFYIMKKYLDLYNNDECAGVGVGIGGEPSQQIAIIYPEQLDRSLKYSNNVYRSGRYMDDGYCICPTKEDALKTLALIESVSHDLKLTLNYKHTHIYNMSNGDVVPFLKKRFSIDTNRNNRIVVRLCKKNIQRERRRINEQQTQFYTSKMTIDEIVQSFMSWRSYIIEFDSYKTLCEISNLLSKYFSLDFNMLMNVKCGMNDILDQYVNRNNFYFK